MINSSRRYDPGLSDSVAGIGMPDLTDVATVKPVSSDTDLAKKFAAVDYLAANGSSKQRLQALINACEAALSEYHDDTQKPHSASVAFRALQHLGMCSEPKGLKWIISNLEHHESAECRRLCVISLVGLNSALAVSGMLTALRDPDDRVVNSAFRVIETFLVRQERAGSALLDDQVCREALRAVARIWVTTVGEAREPKPGVGAEGARAYDLLKRVLTVDQIEKIGLAITPANLSPSDLSS